MGNSNLRFGSGSKASLLVFFPSELAILMAELNSLCSDVLPKQSLVTLLQQHCSCILGLAPSLIVIVMKKYKQARVFFSH